MLLHNLRLSNVAVLATVVLLAISITQPADGYSRMTASAVGRVTALPSGRVIEGTQTQYPALDYLLYVAESAPQDPPVLVVVHGLSRDAHEQIDLFKPFAEQHGFALVAPHFTEDDYPDFQRLGRRGRGLRADLALQQLLAALPFKAARNSVYLFGYSGGGQFAHRFLMAHPQQVKAAVVAAPGWYTLPDPAVAYPYGLRLDGSLPAVSLRPGRFLQVPVLTVVGEDDTDRDKNLRRSKALDRQQGRNRVDRAKRWVAEMSAAAQQYNLDSAYQLAILDDASHSFEDCMRAGMGEEVFEFIDKL